MPESGLSTPIPPTLSPTFTQSATLPPSATVTPTPASTQITITDLYDFEKQRTTLPSGFEESLGAQIQTQKEVWSEYKIDGTVFRTGTKSLNLSSDINTTRWYAIGKQIPSDYREIKISYFVKGHNIRTEGNQFDNCYIGFIITDSRGKKKFKVNQYGSTFDWRSGEIRLEPDELQSIRDRGSSIRFSIFLSKSGEFWIDDLKFEFVPFTQSTSLLTATTTPIVLQAMPLHFEHPFKILPSNKLEEEIAMWQFLTDSIDELSADELTAKPKNLTQLTSAQAVDDVQYLFRLFKHGYAGYGAFNENGKFDQALTAILQILSKRETVSSDVFARIIRSNLDFIFDCHLNIGGYGLFQHWSYYYWDGINFFQDGEHFWTWGAGGKNWLESVNGESPAEYLKLSLTKDGDPVYQLGIIALKQPKDLTLELVSEDGTRETKTGSWLRTPFTGGTTVFSRSTEQGIPVVINRSLSRDDVALQRFQEDAKNLVDEPIFILDLRGNSGGNSDWAEGWMTNLTGIVPQWPFTYSELNTRTAFAGKVNWASSSSNVTKYLESYEIAMNEIDRGIRARGWTPLEMPTFSIIPNEHQLVVVLTDGDIASSGEAFLGYLRQLDNVVFIGENSMGCGVFGDVTFYYLPNSGLPIQLNYKLFVPTDLANSEGKGYMPDLWVPADKALPYAIEAIMQGWLQPP